MSNGGQQPLFHDCITDAIGTAVQVIGGPKKAGALLWPSLSVSAADARVRACLNPERDHKFSPEEVLLIARAARDAGDHSVMQYLGAELGYEVRPVEPRDELASLYAEYVEAARGMGKLAERIARAETRAELRVAK